MGTPYGLSNNIDVLRMDIHSALRKDEIYLDTKLNNLKHLAEHSMQKSLLEEFAIYRFLAMNRLKKAEKKCIEIEKELLEIKNKYISLLEEKKIN